MSEKSSRSSENECPIDDPDVESGVLTSDEIEHCVIKFKLIDPFDKKLLKPARYKLTLGEEYAIDGQLRKLYDQPDKNELTIPPFQVAVVSTKEKLNMPRFLIARWNLDIDLVYEGLLWVGGPQVDPGYQGRLFCPLYNLSNQPVKLRLGDTIASIDFVKTTPFIEGKSLLYPRPPKRKELRDYNYRLQSALYNLAKEKIDAFEKEIDKTSDRVNRSIASIFTVLAILIAAISLVITRDQAQFGIPVWGWCTIVLSISAFVLAIVPFARNFVSSLKKWLRNS